MIGALETESLFGVETLHVKVSRDVQSVAIGDNIFFFGGGASLLGIMGRSLDAFFYFIHHSAHLNC